MSTAEKIKEELSINYISIDQIRPNPYQPRKIFDNRALSELVLSIKEHGVMQPIHLRPLAGTSYELIAGERRWRASKIAGLRVIPAIILNASDQDSALLALLENIQRQNLNYIEEAIGFQNIMNDYKITQDELAKKLGKSQSTIANKLRILRLSPTVKAYLLENNLSERHARSILRLPDEKIQLKILERVVKECLNVVKTEELVEKEIEQMLGEKETDNSKKERKIKRGTRDVRLFSNTIKQAVKVMERSGTEIKYAQKETDSEYIFQVLIKKLI